MSIAVFTISVAVAREENHHLKNATGWAKQDEFGGLLIRGEGSVYGPAGDLTDVSPGLASA